MIRIDAGTTYEITGTIRWRAARPRPPLRVRVARMHAAYRGRRR